MIEVVEVSDHRSWQKFQQSFDPHTQSWLVADNEAKSLFHTHLLERHSFLPDSSLMRASEFWRLLLFRMRPDLRVVSHDYMRSHIAEHLRGTSFAWAQTPAAADSAMTYLKQLIPVLSHPDGEEVLEEWMGSHAQGKARWSHWFEICRFLWQTCLQEKVIIAHWASGLLVNEVFHKKIWERPLWIDLGADFHSIEGEIFKSLSEYCDIKILAPNSAWRQRYESLFIPYEGLRLKGLSFVPAPGPSSTQAKNSSKFLSFRKFASPLAEVKDTVQTVRQWLDEGYRPSDVALVLPHLDEYWPTLSAYLSQEGIPVARDHRASLSSWPEISHWMAKLRLAGSSYDRGDLEVSLFTAQEKPPNISFEHFRTTYSHLYEKQDLERHGSDWAKSLPQEDFFVGRIGRSAFLRLCVQCWPASFDKGLLWRLLQTLSEDIPEQHHWPFSGWLEYLEELVRKQELTLNPACPDGIFVTELSAARYLSCSKVVLLGLTEEALRPGIQTAILPGDLSAINRDTGFQLAAPDASRLEYEAEWILGSSKVKAENEPSLTLVNKDNSSTSATDPNCRDQEIVLTCSLSDFSGEVQAPSVIWLKWSLKSEHDPHELNQPVRCRWDEIQKAPPMEVEKLRSWPAGRAEIVESAVAEDLGEKTPLPFAPGLLERLSASAIEQYLQCPFVLAAQRIYHLSDLPVLDLDIDHMTKGRLYHSLFEQLVLLGLPDLSDAEMANLVDECAEQAELRVGDDRLWEAFKSKYVVQGKRFLQKEKEWQEQFPENRFIACEAPVKGFINTETGLLQKESAADTVKFSGWIDRIDGSDDGSLVVIDYKSGSGSAANHSQWLKQNKLQLALYMQAIENGLVQVNQRSLKGSTVAAVYYVVKNMKRDQGFLLETKAQRLYPAKRRGLQTEGDKEELYEKLAERVRQVIQSVRGGHWNPQPSDEKNCQRCHWRQVCRYPRLN